ncbi:cytochrome C oxidase subunit IV family protein [bacterium]|nr:cytochrome C oxidase subunit IV family protein [bacterium]MCI0614440.1 cytochrome C oxidase subunit IV family protein [bacterium]
MSVDNAEDIKKHVRVYITVFAALLALTMITVGISYLHLPTHWAILFALTVATVKGSLVAAYFMHLISERKVIYIILAICAFFFAFLLWAPVVTSSM